MFKIYEVTYFDRTDGRGVEKVEYFTSEAKAQKAANGWKNYGRPNAIVRTIDVIE